MENVSSKPFGNAASGDATTLYTLSNAAGFSASFTNLGATWVSWLVPDKDGKFDDVLLGFDSAEKYSAQTAYAGAVCGRVANRIAKGKFLLDGVEYTLAVNNGENHLHGGNRGFNAYVWDAKICGDSEEPAIEFSRVSADGEEGYPGNVRVAVKYTLCRDGAVKISYEASADKATPINLTCHAYFNLAGHASGTILDQWLKLASDKFLPTDAGAIPTGEVWNVRGLRPFDFKIFHKIGERIDPTNAQQLEFAKGYDHCYVVNGLAGTLRPAATLVCEENGRVLDVETTEPGLQVYSGNWLADSCAGAPGKGGVQYGDFAGLALETQHVPDAINHGHFRANILVPGRIYTSTTIYRPSLKS
ncbi:MAG: galactose mutarotase [Opitutae bacterium]|nr:galactose mutarotase [Opitutae bacterium]MCD8299092.1 galactose mutarotase [Opitutae bacterium]